MRRSVSLAAWLRAGGRERIETVLRHRPDVLGHEAPGTGPPASLTELAERLDERGSVRIALGRLDLACLQVIDALVVAGDGCDRDALAAVTDPAGCDELDPAIQRLVDHALVWCTGDRLWLADPLRGRYVPAKGRRRRMPLTPQPPPPTTRPVDPAAVDAAAGRAARAAIDAVVQLAEYCAAAPPQGLRAGGVGIRELRKIAKALGWDEPTLRLWLEVARAAGVVTDRAGMVLPTEGYDTWRSVAPAEAYVQLVRAWWHLPETPSDQPVDEHGRAVGALTNYSRARGLGIWHRRRMLEFQPREAGIVDQAAQLARLDWHRPGHHDLAGEIHRIAECAGREAELLGVIADGARSRIGELLGAGDDPGLVEAAAGILPAPVHSARLLPDLTAVVGGSPAPALVTILESMADRERRDVASVWRFSPASVRRALDGGASVDDLLTALGEISEGQLPQPLRYLIGDVVRRHGELRATEVRCCVLGEPALVSEVAARRELREAGIRRLAPTVLASERPIGQTTQLLRDAGYLPVTVDGSGQITVQRTAPRRASQAARREPGELPSIFKHAATAVAEFGGAAPVVESDLAALAERLLAGDEELDFDEPVAPAEPRSGGAVMRFHAPMLGMAEIETLLRAIRHHGPVAIDYVDLDGNPTHRVIEPISVEPPLLVAWCQLRNDERHFVIERIMAVGTVGS